MHGRDRVPAHSCRSRLVHRTLRQGPERDIQARADVRSGQLAVRITGVGGEILRRGVPFIAVRNLAVGPGS